MTTLVIAKVVCLFVAGWFVPVNILRGIRGARVPAANFIITSAAITGFVVIQWKLWIM